MKLNKIKIEIILNTVCSFTRSKKFEGSVRIERRLGNTCSVQNAVVASYAAKKQRKRAETVTAKH